MMPENFCASPMAEKGGDTVKEMRIIADWP